jgi:hypothetical protein
MKRDDAYPVPDRIDAIVGDESRFRHTAGHLYRRSERWDLVVDGFRLNRLYEVIHEGRDGQELRSKDPQAWRVSKACREDVLRDHDRYYGPAYRAALDAAEAAGDRCRWNDGTFVYVGRPGIVLYVRPRPGGKLPFSVRTAYRPALRVKPGREPTNEDFYRESVRKLRDRASIRREDP